MSAAPSHLPTPYPQPSPTRGEGVKSQGATDTERSNLLDSAVAIEAANISTNEAPHRPLWERVGDRGC